MDATHIPLQDDLRTQLGKIIEFTKRQPNGNLFAEPVDAEKLGIPDYPLVIKQPMDLTTLKLRLPSLQYLKDFLIESERIWANCRKYNGNAQDGYYTKAANECEKYFVNSVIKIKDIGLTWDLYKKAVGILTEEQKEQKAK